MFRNLLHTYKIKALCVLFTLMVGSMRIVHAGDFSSSLSYAVQTTQNAIAKNWDRLVPVLSACALVGMGALWYKNLTSDNKNGTRVAQGLSVLTSFEDVDDLPGNVANRQGQNYRVTQLEVSPQGGDASCGYHALKNTWKVLEGVWEMFKNAHQSKTFEVTAELKERLKNADVASQLFGPKGSWRKQRPIQ